MRTVVCLGDSITYGFDNSSSSKHIKQVEIPYPKALQELLGDNYNIINSGNVGWQAKHVLDHLSTLVFDYNPEKVILMLGVNDARGSRVGLPVSMNHYYLNMRKIIERIQDNDIEVLLLTPTPVRFNPRVRQFNRVAVGLAKDLHIDYIDMHKAIKQQLHIDDLKLNDVLADNVHLSQDYYVKLAQIIVDKSIV